MVAKYRSNFYETGICTCHIWQVATKYRYRYMSHKTGTCHIRQVIAKCICTCTCHIRQVIAKYRFNLYEMHYQGKFKFRSHNTYLLTGYEGIASLLSPRLWLLTEVKPRSIVRVEGTTNLLFPNTQSISILLYRKTLDS